MSADADPPRILMAGKLADADLLRIQTWRMRIIRGPKIFGSAHLYRRHGACAITHHGCQAASGEIPA